MYTLQYINLEFPYFGCCSVHSTVYSTFIWNFHILVVWNILINTPSLHCRPVECLRQLDIRTCLPPDPRNYVVYSYISHYLLVHVVDTRTLVTICSYTWWSALVALIDVCETQLAVARAGSVRSSTRRSCRSRNA